MTATAQAAAPVENLPARAKPSLVSKFAAKYTIDAEKLLPILKATAFKQKKGEIGRASCRERVYLCV